MAEYREGRSIKDRNWSAKGFSIPFALSGRSAQHIFPNKNAPHKASECD